MLEMFRPRGTIRVSHRRLAVRGWRWGWVMGREGGIGRYREGRRVVPPIEIDTLEKQQTEKIETEMKDVDRIRIWKVHACCPGWHSGGS